MKQSSLMGIALVTLLLASATQAEGLYGDVGLGMSKAEEDSLEAKDTYIRLGLGVEVTDQIGIEAGVWDFGSDTENGIKVKAWGLYSAARAQVDINPSFQLYGRAGLILSETDVGPDDDRGLDLFIGGGIGTPIGPGLASFEVHLMDLSGIDVSTVGFAYSLPIVF